MNIGILSRGPELYSTKRLVEAGEQRGHNMQVINHTKCYTVMEKNSPEVYIGDHPIEGLDAIIPRIGASVTFYGSSIIRQFEMRGVFTTCSSLALVRSRDKLRSLQILTKSEVGIPKTAFARHPDDVDYLIKQVGGTPLIIKLLEGTQGLGVVLAETSVFSFIGTVTLTYPTQDSGDVLAAEYRTNDINNFFDLDGDISSRFVSLMTDQGPQGRVLDSYSEFERETVNNCESDVASEPPEFVSQCDDGRLNILTCEPVAIYPTVDEEGVGLQLWVYRRGADFATPSYFASPQDLAEAQAAIGDAPLEIGSTPDGFATLYLLPSGEYQVNAGPDEEGKVFVFRFPVEALESSDGKTQVEYETFFPED